jgi:signal transduction histidine kinase
MTDQPTRQWFDHPPARYGLAVTLTLAAVLARAALDPILGERIPYLTIYPAIMIVAVVVGTGPAIATTLLSVVLIEFYFFEAGLGLTASLVVRSVILLLTSIYVGRVGEKLRLARSRAEAEAASARQAEEALQRDHREVALTNRILKVFVERGDEGLFAPVLDIFLEELASRHGVFGYIPKPGHLICPSLSTMLDECEVEGKCIHYPPEKWKGLWARALTEKRALISNQPARVPPGHVPIRNNLAVPVLFQGEAVGLLNLANKESDYTEYDRKLLEAAAGRIAPVLYAWIQQRLREEERQRAEAELQRAHGELEQRVRERTRVLKTTVEALETEIVQRRELEETLRASEQQARFFAAQYLAAQEQERKRIAGELHDSLASTLVAAKYRLEKMARELEAGLDPGGTLEEVITILSGLNKEVRRIMVDLRPAVLDDLGLLPALNWLCREFEKTYGQIRVEKQTEVAENELAETLKTPIFRLTQEALNNVAKHSGASRVTFSLSKVDGRIVLIIRDNGRGFDPLAVVRGLGLTTMKERTELSGGEYRLESACGQGTVLFASWPLRDCIESGKPV